MTCILGSMLSTCFLDVTFSSSFLLILVKLTVDNIYSVQVERWWDVLLPKMIHLLYDNGGPIIMVQVGQCATLAWPSNIVKNLTSFFFFFSKVKNSYLNLELWIYLCFVNLCREISHLINLLASFQCHL